MPWEVVSWRVFEASQPDADANWEMTVRSLHHKKRISPSPDAFQTFASHQCNLIRRKRWKRRRVMLGCFWFLFSSKEVRLIFFNKQGHWGLVGSGNGGLINWLDLPKHATILLQFFKSSTFIYSVFACFLHMFICFWFFLHVFALACATFHSCTKYSIHLNTRLLATMQDSGLHVSCFYTAQSDYSGPLLLHWAWNVGKNSYPSYHCEPLSDAVESWSRCVLKLDVTSGHFIDVDTGMSQNL